MRQKNLDLRGKYRIEKNLYEGPVDPNNVNAVKDLIQQVSANGVHSNINAISGSSNTN